LNAQYAEESYQLKRENCTLKKQIEEINLLNNNTNSTKNSNSSDFLVQPNNNELEVLHETVNRLSAVCFIKFFYCYVIFILISQQENRRLQSTPNSEIASLQEELTLVKMRDAEAQAGMNEIRQRIADLNREWQLHDSTCMNNNNPTNDAYDIIAHELISLKMREAQTDCDNKVLSQKIMDIETQKQVLHNQIKRQDDEVQRIRLELDQYRIRENEFRRQLHDMKNQMHDGELRVNFQKRYSFLLIINQFSI
jgi:septal ring factor EnvC (AmiA/AmiB activator)